MVLLLPSSLINAAREYVYTSVFISVSGSIIENYQFVRLHLIPTQQHRIYFIFMLLFFFNFWLYNMWDLSSPVRDQIPCSGSLEP